MKKTGIVVLILALVAAIAAFAIQGVVKGKVNEFVKSNPMAGMIGLSSNLTPADVQPFVKDADTVREIKSTLQWFGMSRDEVNTLIMGMQAFAATPVMLIAAGIAAALGAALTVAGVVTGRRKNETVYGNACGTAYYSSPF